MADTPRSFQDLVRRRQKADFIGRDGELAHFRANITRPPGERRLLFSIHGAGGVGKTSLLGRLREVAAEHGWLTAGADESCYDAVEVMAALAVQLEEQDAKLRRFTQQHAARRKRGTEGEPPAADVAGTLTRTATELTTGVVNTLVPGAELITKAVDPERVNQLRLATADKLRGRPPTGELTPAFLEGLRELRRPLALFLDAYEVTDAYLDDWLRAVFTGRYGEAPADLIITIAGRRPLDPIRWDPYLGVVAEMPLMPFTEVEVRQFLAQLDVVDEPTVGAICHESGGLPLAVAMLSRRHRPGGECPGAEAEARLDPSSGLVERFLKWERDPARRALVLDAALPRRLDEDIVAALTGENAAELYTWLHAQDFLTRQGGTCRYHDTVRRPMIGLSRSRSPQRWSELHVKLAAVYRERRTVPMEEAWGDERAEGWLLEECYHRACAAPAAALPGLLTVGVAACAHGVPQARRWAETIAAAGVDADAARLAALGRELRDSVPEGCDLSAFADLLLRRRELPAEQRKHVHRLRGREHRYAGRYEQALADYDRAIELDPAHAKALAGRAETLRLARRHDEALACFDRALELAPENRLVSLGRAYTLESLERHEEARQALDLLIAAEPRDAGALKARGRFYLLRERLEEALADLDLAIELDPSSCAALTHRAFIHLTRERRADALADLGRALALVPDDVLALTVRGRARWLMNDPDAALADLDRAVALEPDDAWALAHRGVVHQDLGRHAEAVADLSRAVEFEPGNAWAIASRGDSHEALGRTEEALADLDRAIELAPRYAWALCRRGSIRLKRAEYERALADFSRASGLVPRYEVALAGRSRALTLLGRWEEALEDQRLAMEIVREQASVESPHDA
ncbi:tetratricopeptide repeat protein [Nonomuraea sp. NPDC050547]|uniref:tetratricopeptide repeat protein n=1 Tax=Nonomuraea sp. NPDC050547 TaxID=3364368 RepID=UPI0037956563